MLKTTKTPRAHLNVETLEDRLALSLYTATFSNGTLTAWSNNSASDVRITRSGSTTTIRDVTNNFSRSYTGVNLVQVVGGASNDKIVNYVSTLAMKAWGKGGDDYLEGYNAVDYLMGGDGNDKLVGYGGDDRMWGENGDDVILGMAGNDQMIGGDGNDRLNGREGYDKYWGGNGDDVLIAIDSSTGDTVQGDAGRDIIWVDKILWYRDSTPGLSSSDTLQQVSSFSNGADRTLNGDRISDPTVKSGHTYRRFSGNVLFSSSGPRASDVRQGALGDCWLLAGAAAVAYDNSFALRQNIVDFDDGTYGVRLGNKFYRVDDDLAVSSSTSTSPVYAGLGAQSSMWVAILEKAYAHYRTGANTFASIEGGWAVEVNNAFRSSSSGQKAFNAYSNATTLANDIYNRWMSFQAVTVGFLTVASGCPCIGSHMYAVQSVARNSSGVVTSITLRNPWGVDGAGNDGNNDGLVTVTPAQIFASTGRVNWGRV